MRVINTAEVIPVIERLCKKACYELNDNVMNAFRCALEKEESPIGKESLEILIESGEYAKEHQLPCCHDTGATVVVMGIHILLIVYTYAHYGFASLTAHITAMYSAFLTVAIATDAPAYLVALGFAFMSNLCMSITHYAASPAPIYYGAGYVPRGKWWSLGFQVSVINLIIWIGVGSLWWKTLGLW